MSDLVGNPEDRFSRVAAHIVILFCPEQKDTPKSTVAPVLSVLQDVNEQPFRSL